MTSYLKVILPFWDEYGIDHKYGGIMCSLDYDGTLLDTRKNLWFLGRAIWIYSFLYNHFGKSPEFLEVAKKTRNLYLSTRSRRTAGGQKSYRGKETCCVLSAAIPKACTSPGRRAPGICSCQRRRAISSWPRRPA